MKFVFPVVLLALFASLPSLDEEASQQVRQDQQHFNTSLTSESRARFFPPHGNSKPGRLTGLPHHFMTQYQPYLSIKPHCAHISKAQCTYGRVLVGR